MTPHPHARATAQPQLWADGRILTIRNSSQHSYLSAGVGRWPGEHVGVQGVIVAWEVMAGLPGPQQVISGVLGLLGSYQGVHHLPAEGVVLLKQRCDLVRCWFLVILGYLTQHLDSLKRLQPQL